MDQNTAEFSILELEDRLEFAELCDDNCGCITGGTNNCTSTGPTTEVPVNAYCGGGGGGDLGGGDELSAIESPTYAY